MRPRLHIVAAFLVALSAHGASGATLNADQMRSVAAQAIVAGAPGPAREMAEALLERDPGDVEALLILSRAARDLGDYETAKDTAARAWTLAREKPRKFSAALAMAQATSSAGNRIGAQLWLRRAVNHAPDARARALAIRDFRYLRKVSPLSVYLSFGIAPNSNINNGSAHSSVDIFGLPDVNLVGAAQALSGVEYSAGLSLRYRLAQSPTRATDLTFRASRRDYTLSSDAKALAPTAKGSDFALSTVSAGISQRFMQSESRAETTVALELGKTWYGGDPYSDFTRLSLGHVMPLSRSSRLAFGLIGERTTGPRAPHADLLRLTASWSKGLASGGLFGLSMQVTDSQSSSSSADYREVAARISYAPAKPLIEGVHAQFGLGLRMRDYPVTAYLPSGGRQDREISTDMTLDFRNLEYYGFTPTLTLRASRSNSNVGLFDVENLGMAMGIRSSF